MKNAIHALSLVTLVTCAGAIGGCSSASGDDSVTPRLELVDRTSQALSTGALKFANGTYTNCTSRSGAWSVRISGTDAMDHPELTVVHNDASCELTLTSVVADGAYVAAPSILMGSSYAGSASPMAQVISTVRQPVAFYANAKLSAVDFASNFTMTLLYSDNLRDASASATAIFASVSSSTSTTQVASPDSSLDFGGLVIQTDAADVVDSTSGNLGVTAGSHPGELYMISTSASLGTVFADIDAAWTGGTPLTLGSTIAASELTLDGLTLPVTRTLIIAHTENDVRAYQVARITFNAPSP